MKPVLY